MNRVMKKHPIWQIMVSVVFTIITLALGGCAIDVSTATFVHQDKEVTPIDTTQLHQRVNRDEAEVSITTVQLTNAQGIMLKGIAVSYPEPVVNIVFFGGNGMTISKSSGLMHQFGKIPANILWVDYQGMGASQKAPGMRMANIKADALQIYDYGKSVFPGSLPTVVHGLSMGSIVASYVASVREVDGLVLDGAINRITDVAQNMVPQWTKYFTYLSVSADLAMVDNADYIRNYHGPLLILAGRDDELTPVAFGRELYDVSPSYNKEIIMVPGARHAENMEHRKVVPRYREFLRSFELYPGY